MSASEIQVNFANLQAAEDALNNANKQFVQAIQNLETAVKAMQSWQGNAGTAANNLMKALQQTTSDISTGVTQFSTEVGNASQTQQAMENQIAAQFQ